MISLARDDRAAAPQIRAHKCISDDPWWLLALRRGPAQPPHHHRYFPPVTLL